MAALPPQPVDANGQPFTRGTSETELDQWNQKLRASDLYQNFLKQQGLVDTGRGVTMSRGQQAALEQALAQAGIQIPTKDFQIDQGGNLNQGNRLKRNLAIAAAIGVGGYVAAPYIGSALGLGGGAAPVAGTAGTVTGEGLGTGSLLAGEGGIAGLGGAAGGGVGAGSGVLATGGTVAGSGGALSTLGHAAMKAAPYVKGLGSEIGAATNAAGNNRLNQEQLGLTANSQNITGNSAFETELMNRAKLEADQRKEALKDQYRASWATNRTPGPFNTAGLTKYSPSYLSSLAAMDAQGASKLGTGAQYDTSKMPALAPYNPLDPKNVQGATNTQKGKLETLGDWVGPAMSMYDKIASAYGGK